MDPAHVVTGLVGADAVEVQRLRPASAAAFTATKTHTGAGRPAGMARLDGNQLGKIEADGLRF